MSNKPKKDPLLSVAIASLVFSLIAFTVSVIRLALALGVH